MVVDKVLHPNSLDYHWNILVLAHHLSLFHNNLEEASMVVDLDLDRHAYMVVACQHSPDYYFSRGDLIKLRLRLVQ